MESGSRLPHRVLAAIFAGCIASPVRASAQTVALDLRDEIGAEYNLATGRNFSEMRATLAALDSTLFANGIFADFDIRDPGNRQLLENIGVYVTSGRDDMVLMPFDPGLPGQTNTLRAFEALPGRRVFFVISLAPGSTPIPGCGGTVELQGPVLVGSALADASGTATLAVSVPANAAGRTYLLQAAHVGPCGVTNVLRATF